MKDLFIDGNWTEAVGDGTTQVINPYDASVLCDVALAGPEDVAEAVIAARRAFRTGSWPATSAGERAALLHRIADLLQRDREELARIESLDTGKTLEEGGVDVDDVVAVFRYYAAAI